MISWTLILWTALRWQKGLKAQGIDRKTLPYCAPFQPYLSYCESITHTPHEHHETDLYPDGICVAVLVIIFGGFTAFMPAFDASSFVTTYFPIPFFLVLAVGYWYVKKSKMISHEEMDFYTGSSIEYDTLEKPNTFMGKLNEYI